MNRQDAGNRRIFFSTHPLSDVSGFSFRALPRLPPGEYERFVKAWKLLGSGGVVALVREGDMAVTGAGVCEALLARSWAVRYLNAEEMLRLATVAQEVAGGLGTRDLGRAGVAGLQARACGELGNALRVAGRAAEAEPAFEEAFDLEGEHGDPYLNAHLLHMRATLYGRSGDPGFAAQLLELVSGFYDDSGERYLGGRTRITQSIYAAHTGQGDAALRLNEEGLAQIGRAQDPALAMTALHNRLLLLLRLGRKQEAKRAIDSWGGFAADGPVALRLRWMEGSILRSLGELEEAEAALRQSRDGLSILGLKRFTAMASLELAAALLLQNRYHDAQAEALTAQRILLGMADRERYFGVLMVLDAAFSSGGVTAELVERALAALR
ncbi:MAG TPA: hypothetical protein VF179_03025 [Thermoanaerobaculia bacterium]|nr:hypothetical protein [Thermoanaerobaculia bacterium]